MSRRTARMVLSASMNDGWLPEGIGLHQTYREGERMDDGLPQEWLSTLKELGFTLLQVDSPFCNVPREDGDGKWDWPNLDALMSRIKDNGFDTAFFGRCHWPSKEIESSPEFTGLVCMEHGKSIPCWSVWSPNFQPRLDDYMAGLRDRYNSGGRNTLDVLYMGVQGDFGETTFPDFYYSDHVLRHDRGPGDYHCHAGFWCGDEYAIGSFRDCMKRKYSDVERLNSAWHSDYATFADVGFPGWPFPDRRRPWLDFIEWYTGSMTAFASEHARTARKCFTDNTIMIPLGTGCQAVLSGQDETALAKEMSRHKVAIRTTAGAAGNLERPRATEGFCRLYPYVKLISTACGYYGAPLWIEPPYPPGPSGSAMLWGLFEALSHGATGYMQWSRTVIDNQDFYRKYGDFFTVERPLVDAAVLFPTTNHRARATNVVSPDYVDLCAKLRRAADYDVLDERLVRDGALKNYKLLILFEGRLFEEETLSEIKSWVESGGIFVLYDTGFPLETVEGSTAYTETFTGIGRASIPYSVHEITWHADALSRTALSGIEWAPSVRNLSGDVNVLMRSKTDGAIVWEKKLGDGRCIVFAGDFSHKDLYLEIVRDCVYNRHLIDPKLKSPPPITEGWDDVFSTLTENWVFVLNLTDQETVCHHADQDVVVEPQSLARIDK